MSRERDAKVNEVVLRCNSTFYSNAFYKNTVIADPLFLPRKSVMDLRVHEPSIYSKIEWFSPKTNQFSKVEAKDTVTISHVC